MTAANYQNQKTIIKDESNNNNNESVLDELPETVDDLSSIQRATSTFFKGRILGKHEQQFVPDSRLRIVLDNVQKELKVLAAFIHFDNLHQSFQSSNADI